MILYKKPFLLHVHTWTRPGRIATGLQFTPHSFSSGVLPGCPSRMQPRDGCKHLPIYPHNLVLPSYFPPPPPLLHVPCVSPSPHAKNRCDNVIGASGRTEVRLAGKWCWGRQTYRQTDTTCDRSDVEAQCVTGKRIIGKVCKSSCFISKTQQSWMQFDIGNLHENYG